MGIKLDEKTMTYEVSYSRRPQGGGPPVSLKRKGLKSKAEAQRVYNELVIKVEKKLRATKVPTWKIVVESFVKSKKGVDWTDKTYENYALHLRAYTYKEWGERLVDSIQSYEIQDLIKIKMADKSESHRKSVHKYINAAFNYAIERGFIFRNPVQKMKFRIGDKIKDVLTEEQVRLLLSKAKEVEHDWYYHWAAALYTGMRTGELYALTWDCIDLDKGLILVRKSWNNKEGFKDSTKSGDDRKIDIAPQFKEILIELKASDPLATFVLPRLVKWDKGEQARELRMFLQALGLPRIRFHDLRATWATILLGKGVEPLKVMIMAGWKDLKTMQRYIRKAGVDITGISDKLKF